MTGTGNLGGSGTLAALQGASNISIINNSNLPLATGSIVNTGATGQIDIALNGTVSITPGWYGSPSGQINLSSLTSIDLQKQLSSPNGTISLNSGGDITGPTGVPLIDANNINLTASGSIGPNLGIEMTEPLGLLNAQAGGPITLTAITGDMGVGTVTSATGGVTLTADQGSILNGDGRLTANITGVGGVTLTAPNGSIGTAATALNLGSSTGVLVAANAGQDVNLTAVSGDLDLLHVGAAAGNATLTASGSILNADQRTTSNIDAGNITLTAQTGSIGTSSAALNVNEAPTGNLVAAAENGIYINQLGGSLNAKQVTSAAGNISLIASSGNVNVGSVTAQTGDVVITASGSIVSASPSSQPNVFGDNVTLTASGGGIGNSAAPLVTQASGFLNSFAVSDIFLRQIGGNLNSQNMVSQNGSLYLTVDKGNGNLQYIAAPQNVILLVNGNLLNIGIINPAQWIQIDLTDKHGILDIGQMFVGPGSMTTTADVTYIRRLFHISSFDPLFFDITTTEGGFNQRPLDPGILLANSWGTLAQREWEKRFSLRNRRRPPESLVIDRTKEPPNSGAGK
jgi:hypothetical protein